MVPIIELTVRKRITPGTTGRFDVNAYTAGQYRCRICHTTAKTPNDRPPPGWFRLIFCGEGALDFSLPVIGFTCSQPCLVVAVLRPYGLRDQEIRQWLADVQKDLAQQ
jgi:hypothetical protein